MSSNDVQDKLNLELIENLQMDVPKPESIKSLLEKGANPNLKHKFVNTYTTITNAINTQHGSSILYLLLEHGLDANLRDINNYDNGNSLLHYVILAKKSQIGLVKLLVNYNATIDFQNAKGVTPLMCAVERNLIDITNYLLTNGANPNIKNNNGISSLHIASYNNLNEMLIILLQYKASADVIDNQGHTPLIYAISKRHKDIIKLLLTYCNESTISNGLKQVFYRQDLEIVKLIVEDNSFDTIYDNQEVLLDCITFILEQFLETLNDNTLLIIKWLVSYIGSYMFTEILQAQPNILTELMYIYSSDVNKIQFLIDLGLIVDSVNSYSGDTSLIVSAKNSYTNIEIVKCLLANVKKMSLQDFINTENNQGETALILFVNFADNIIKLLIQNGGDINYKNKNGETFFMYACKSSFDINYLIKNGANINNQDNDGETALIWAIKDENDTNVQILLENNPDILLQTNDNKNAYQIALDINNATILRLLSEHILQNNIDLPTKYHKLIMKYTSDNSLSWKDSCKVKDRFDIQKYKELLTINETEIDEICSELDSYEHKLTKYKQDNINKCINTDNLDGNDVQDIYPENFYTYTDNNVTYCEDIRTLFKLLKSFKKRQPPKTAENPYTGKPFSAETIQDIEAKYKLYNTISTGKQLEEITTPTTPSSKDILLGQLSFFYNIMKNLSPKDIFISSPQETIQTFMDELQDIKINNTLLFNKKELQKIINEDINKYKYQLIQLLLSKILVDKYKFIEGEIITYPTRDSIQNIWNKVFK